MIGGYARQSCGFNYYGTVGSNRVDWIDGRPPGPA
jgi:nitrate reductase alpha subunit